MNPSKPKLNIETENFIVGEFNFMFKKYAKDCSFVSASMFADKLNITLVKYSTLSTEIFETAMKISEYGFFCTDTKGHEYIYLNDVGTTSSKQESTIFHELGHVTLDHDGTGKNEEAEANFYEKYAILCTRLSNKIRQIDKNER